jgi:hypothetical protein
MAGKKLSCPNCGREDEFATIEKIIATSKVENIDSNGRIEWVGETDWDDSETIGLICFGCNWEVEGTDWLEKQKEVAVKLSDSQKILLKEICDDEYARYSISDDGIMDIADGFFAQTKGSTEYVEKETPEDHALWEEAHRLAWDYIQYLDEKRAIQNKIDELSNPFGNN